VLKRSLLPGLLFYGVQLLLHLLVLSPGSESGFPALPLHPALAPSLPAFASGPLLASVLPMQTPQIGSAEGAGTAGSSREGQKGSGDKQEEGALQAEAGRG